jgi:hypothetical protein
MRLLSPELMAEGRDVRHLTSTLPLLGTEDRTWMCPSAETNPQAAELARLFRVPHATIDAFALFVVQSIKRDRRWGGLGE